MSLDEELRAVLRDGARHAGTGPVDRMERVRARHRARRRAQLTAASLAVTAVTVTAVALPSLLHTTGAANRPLGPAGSGSATASAPVGTTSSSASSGAASTAPASTAPASTAPAGTVPTSGGANQGGSPAAGAGSTPADGSASYQDRCSGSGDVPSVVCIGDPQSGYTDVSQLRPVTLPDGMEFVVYGSFDNYSPSDLWLLGPLAPVWQDRGQPCGEGQMLDDVAAGADGSLWISCGLVSGDVWVNLLSVSTDLGTSWSPAGAVAGLPGATPHFLTASSRSAARVQAGGYALVTTDGGTSWAGSAIPANSELPAGNPVCQPEAAAPQQTPEIPAYSGPQPPAGKYVVFNASGPVLADLGKDTGTQLATFDASWGCLAWTSDVRHGWVYFAVARQGDVLVQRAATGAHRVQTLQTLPAGTAVTSMAVSADGTRLAYATRPLARGLTTETIGVVAADGSGAPTVLTESWDKTLAGFTANGSALVLLGRLPQALLYTQPLTGGAPAELRAGGTRLLLPGTSWLPPTAIVAADGSVVVQDSAGLLRVQQDGSVRALVDWKGGLSSAFGRASGQRPNGMQLDSAGDVLYTGGSGSAITVGYIGGQPIEVSDPSRDRFAG